MNVSQEQLKKAGGRWKSNPADQRQRFEEAYKAAQEELKKADEDQQCIEGRFARGTGGDNTSETDVARTPRRRMRRPRR